MKIFSNPSNLKLILVLEVDRAATHHALRSTVTAARLGGAGLAASTILLLTKHALTVAGLAFQSVWVFLGFRRLGPFKVRVLVGRALYTPGLRTELVGIRLGSVTAGAFAVSFTISTSIASIPLSAMFTISLAISVTTITLAVPIAVPVSASTVPGLVTILLAVAGPVFARPMAADTTGEIARFRRCLAAIGFVSLFDRGHSIRVALTVPA